MKTRSYLMFVALLSIASLSCGGDQSSLKQNDSMPGYTPKAGFVPDSKTAIAIAIAVLIPIYGEDEINARQPYVATLSHGTWTITGRLPRHLAGGVPVVKLVKSTGRILKVSSGKRELHWR